MKKKNSITCRKFQLTVISASNLRDDRKYFKPRIYAKISFSGKCKAKKRTPVDKNNGINPAWNYNKEYVIAETGIQQDGLMLVIKLYSWRTFGGKYIGEVHTSIRDLFSKADPQGLSSKLQLQVMNGSAPIQDAFVNMSYNFGENFEIKEPSVWQKAFRSGAVILFRVTLLSTLGIDVPIAVRSKSNIIGRSASNK